MNSEKNILKVKILDIEYPLKVNENVEYIQQIAHYVDRKMREIQATKPERPLHQIAILAALNIADELHQQVDNKGKNFETYEERIELLTQKLELGIKKSLEDDDLLKQYESDNNLLD